MKLDGTEGDLKVWADRDRLCEALTNLVSNGIESSPRNGTVDVSVQDTAAEIEFRVIDHGAGIPDDQQEKIFDRFVQVKTSDRRKYRRSGLSLALTKAIVEERSFRIRMFLNKLPNSPGIQNLHVLRHPSTHSSSQIERKCAIDFLSI